MGQSWRRGFTPEELAVFEQGIQEIARRHGFPGGLPPIGDQRAKDLIDRNEGETDPHRAIRRLHRALRYGREDIQAHKAYQDLGMYYEGLGNPGRAIFYYTKAIELGDRFGGSDPSAGVANSGYPNLHFSVTPLYYRGQVYARRGEHAAARRDFERAAALEVGPKFLAPDLYALANVYLAGGTPDPSEI